MWRDKKDVLLLSEIYDDNTMEIEKLGIRLRKPTRKWAAWTKAMK